MNRNGLSDHSIMIIEEAATIGSPFSEVEIDVMRLRDETHRIRCLENRIRDVVTLGPHGTDSENAAKHLQSIGEAKNVILEQTFRSALDYAMKNDANFLVPAAYIHVEDEQVVDSWGKIHFEVYNKMKVANAFALPLKEMGIAGIASMDSYSTMALHRATLPFVHEVEFEKDLDLTFIKSKPEAVQRCSQGEFDLCIGSVDVINKYNNLEVVKSFQPEMVWTLYTRR